MVTIHGVVVNPRNFRRKAVKRNSNRFLGDAFHKNINETGATTHYVYSPAGSLLSATDAIGGILSYTYDANKNLTSATDELGNVTALTYDDMDRITRIGYPDGTYISFHMTGAGA